MKVCCLTPSYYRQSNQLDDQRFTRLLAVNRVKDVHHLYRGSVQTPGRINNVKHIRILESAKNHQALAAYLRTLPTYVRNHDVDVVYCHDFRLAPLVAIAWNRLDCSTVFECGVDWRHSFDSTAERFTWVPTLKFIFRLGVFDQVVALADHLAASVEDLGATNVRTIYPLNNKNLFSTCTEGVSYPEDSVILYVGRISPEKAVHHLLEHFERLSAVVPDVGLHFVGDNINQKGGRTSYAKRVRQAAATNDRIHFHGWIEYADLPPYYAGADVVALPSATEGFPSVLGEALSAGVPVVCSDIPAFREIVTPAFGRIAPVESPDYADALAELLTDDKERDRLSANGREFVESRCAQSQTKFERLFADIDNS